MGDPVLALARTSTAVTYEFRSDQPMGWVTCTINDATRELAIQSDWTSCSYRWTIDGFTDTTLTGFIGSRDSLDYLAVKLLGREGTRRFDLEATIDAYLGQVLELRRARQVSAAAARDAWDAIHELIDVADRAEFCDRMDADIRIEEFRHRIDDSLQYYPSLAYKALVGWILPALANACRGGSFTGAAVGRATVTP